MLVSALTQNNILFYQWYAVHFWGNILGKIVITVPNIYLESPKMMINI